MRRSATGRQFAVSLAPMLLAVTASAPAQAIATGEDAAPVVNAVRVEREVELVYMGFTSYYSCDGLRDKVRRVLVDLGLGDGLKVSTRGCIRVTGPETMPSVRIVAQVPVEATPEVLAQLESEAGKRELVARAKGVAPAEATAQFPVRRRRVEFEADPLGDLQEGDCELVEQLRDRVFPKLGVKVVEDRTQCAPRQVRLGSIHTVVEVLEPVPPPGTVPSP
jgi:hypothetical protein